jgi:hypothetical protein
MRSPMLVFSLVLLAACEGKGSDDSNPGTDDSSGVDDSGGKTDDSGTSAIDADKDGYDSTADCDDTNAAVNPAATEVCDEIDNNCVDGIDEGVTLPFYADGDGDTYGAGTAVNRCSAPAGFVENDDDCDDLDASAYPGGTEVCDGIDNNCADGIDEGVTSPFFADGDSDGHGAGTEVNECAAPTGYVVSSDDCDDTDANAYPGAAEVCDDIDNDCDADIDDDDSDLTDGATYYEDGDGDGYGDPGVYTTACDMPRGYVDNSDDCYDGDSLCTVYEYKYVDNDLDGYGFYSTSTCCESDYYSDLGGDCDDDNDVVYPGAAEVCDEEDNDCNGAVDGDDPGILYETWYADADVDGYGDDSTATDTCDPAPGYVMMGGDCDDAAYLVSPGRNEYCDGIDNNCTGGADETADYVDWYRDDDGDHYGQDGDMVNDCDPPAGYDLNSGDCDDTNADTNPGEEEVCGDDVDNECDGYVDNCFVDIDDAGFSLSGNTSSAQLGYTLGSGDFNGDGTDDLLAGTPYVSDYTTFTYSYGAIYLVNGATSGNITTSDADAELKGSASYTYFGSAITSGDVDGDGFDDLLAAGAWATTGQAFLFMGPLSSATTSSADATFSATSMYTSYGNGVALANLDGDTDLDTAIAEPWDSTGGMVSIYYGPVSGSVSSADLVVQPAASYTYTATVTNLGDMDGDGLDELAMASANGGGSYQGEIDVLYPGSSTGTVSASSIAVAVLTGESSSDYFGYKMAGGDYNADGYADLFATAMYNDDMVTSDRGRVYGFMGPVSGTMSASSADVMLTGDTMYGDLGTDVAVGDVSGDGAADVVIGAGYTDTYRGKVYVLSGPTTGAFELSAAALIGGADAATEYSGYVGYSVKTMGDWSGDGADEIIIGGFGIPYDDGTVINYSAGRTWVVSSDDL